MRALLDLISTVEDVRAIVGIVSRAGGSIVHKTHQRLLDDQIISDGSFTTNFGGYGSRSRLNVGAKFSGSWEINGLDLPKGKIFSFLRVFFQGDHWSVPIAKLQETLFKLGGQLVDRIESAHIVVCSEAATNPTLIQQLIVRESVLYRLDAFSPAKKEKKKVALPLSGDAVSIWKLLSSRDRSSIDQGVALAAALPEEIEQILSTCDVSDAGDLLRGPRFSSTGPAQRYLDIALLGLLSVAPDGTNASMLRSKIQRITLTLGGIPMLKGFDALQVLVITLAAGTKFPNLKNLGELPSLLRLSILPEGDTHRRAMVTLTSTDGLIAPNLEILSLVAINLEQINQISDFKALKKIDLSENSELKEIIGDSSILRDVESINFFKCKKIKSLQVFSSCEKISRVNLKDCYNLEDLDFLSRCKDYEQLIIDGCSSLQNLNGLRGSSLGNSKTEEYSFDLIGCDSLADIKGFPRLSSPIYCVDLSELDELDDLSGIEAAAVIKELKLDGIGVASFSSLRDFKRLEELSASRCDYLVDASALGDLTNLKRINFKGCGNLTTLPTRWGERLESLNVEGCSSIKSLGVLPSSVCSMSDDEEMISFKGCKSLEVLSGAKSADFVKVKRIDLSSCNSLTSLDGLNSTESLSSIQLPKNIVDVAALSANRRVELILDMNGFTSFPEVLADSLKRLNSPILKIRNGDDLEDCSALAVCPNLSEIDLSTAYQLSNLDWIVGLPKIKGLRLAVGSPIAKKLKGANFEHFSQIRQLQVELCGSENLLLPEHLNATLVTDKELSKDAFSLRDVRKSLLSNDFWSAHQAVMKIAESGDLQIYEEILGDLDTDVLFSESETRFDGGLFINVKASSRSLAKLIVLWLFATAPERSEFIQDRLLGIRRIELKFKDSIRGNVVPDLIRFSSLREVDFTQIDLQNLSCFANAIGLRSISISNADSLSSLVGLEQLSKLQSLSLYGCPSLNDLMTLEKLPNLKDLNAYDTGPLHDLSFVQKLKRFSDLSLTISSKTNLSVLTECAWLQDVNLYLQSGEAIEVDLDMPSLEKISFRSTSPWDEERARPIVSFKKLNSKNLDSINFFGVSVENLEGISTVKDIDFYYCDIRSLAGLAKTSVVALDLSGINKVPASFDSISSVTTLKRLTLPTEEVVVQQLPMHQLRGLANVEYLDTTGLSGSLAWLEGWTSLTWLKLEKSGRLIDLDILSKLPKLETIIFRGAVTKKDDLLESIQSRSTFK